MRAPPVLLATLLSQIARGLQIYDCEARGTTHEAVDLLSTQECPYQKNRYAGPREEQQVQVLHSGGFGQVEGTRCRVVLTRMASTCGGGLAHRIYGSVATSWRDPISIPARQCQDMAAKGIYEVPGERKHQLKFEVGVPTSGSYFMYGETDGQGYTTCDSFQSGDTHIRHGYEQTMVELLVDHITGLQDANGGDVEFLGVREATSRRTFEDPTTGRVIWDPDAGARRGARTSQVYIGPGEVYPLGTAPTRTWAPLWPSGAWATGSTREST